MKMNLDKTSLWKNITKITGLFLCLLFIISSLNTVSADSPSDKKSEKGKQKEIERIAQNIEVPGMQVVHFKDGEAKSYVYGKLNYIESAEVNSETIFQAASLSKVIGAYIFFRLYDRGIIELDVPLSKYYNYDRLSEEPYKDEITARTVLMHTTGLPNWAARVFSSDWYDAKLKAQFKPGTAYRYSGEACYYLQLAMEAVTGKSIQQLAEEELLTPFGMKNSSFVWKESFDANAAYGHDGLEKPLKRSRFKKANMAYTFLTTATDYTTFIQRALVKGEGLKPETYKLMTETSRSTADPKKPKEADKYLSVGMIVRIQENEKGKALWHTGSNTGFRCFFMVYPETGESVACFTNGSKGPGIAQVLPAIFGKDQTFWVAKR